VKDQVTGKSASFLSRIFVVFKGTGVGGKRKILKFGDRGGVVIYTRGKEAPSDGSRPSGKMTFQADPNAPWKGFSGIYHVVEDPEDKGFLNPLRR